MTALSPGKQLGPYEILAPLGAGGMGEVWRARDTRLDRDVAIKVLPEAVEHSPERLLRFEREAKVLAALSHPNIAAIYGFEEHRLLAGATQARHLLIHEFVDGPTLADRLRQGAIPVDEALDIGKQIAEALEAAHEKGIIHRDLKPANVKITSEGKVKVLDFGLAKALSDDSSGSRVSDSPTITAQYTQPGMVLGTAAYMSPEQARGKPLDKRTDIWSFGCVLYECLTCLRLFDGESSSDIIAKILERDPDFAALPPRTPPRVQDLLRHALEKNSKRRLRDIGDAVIELEASISSREWSTTGVHRAAPASGGSIRRIAVRAAFVALVAFASFAGWRMGRSAHSPQGSSIATRFMKLTDLVGMESLPSLSPDGKTVVYVARDGDDLDVFSLRVGGLNPINLTGDGVKDDTQPAYSPDGSRIVFRTDRDGGGLFVMGATGESPQRLTDFGFDPKWSPDGQRIVFATEGISNPLSRNTTSALWSVDVSSGEKKKISEGDAVQPSWSPHNRRIAYWAVWKKGGQRDIYTIPASGGEPVELTDDPATDWNPVWSPDGRFIYFCSNRGGSMNLWRIAVDEETGRPRGDCEPVTAGVTSCAQPSLSADGRMIAFTSTIRTSAVERVGFDPIKGEIQGAAEPISHLTGLLEYAGVSPNGKWIACTYGDRQEDLFLIRVDGTERRQLTNDLYKDRGPCWSPDGKRLAFYSDRSGKYEVWLINTDGSNLTQLSKTTDPSVTFPRWSRDGGRLFYSAEHLQVVIVDPNKPMGGPAAKTFSPVEPPRSFSPTCWSPDGRSIAGYVYDSSSGASLGVAVFDPDSKKLRQITEKGEHPEFLHDGQRLIFGQDEARLMLADMQGGPAKLLLDVSPDALPSYAVCVAKEDSAIYYTRIKSESDVWLLQLE